jgi:hypothetical protein
VIEIHDRLGSLRQPSERPDNGHRGKSAADYRRDNLIALSAQECVGVDEQRAK